MYYRLALLHEALEEYPEAVKSHHRARDAYFNEILLVKHRLEQSLGDPKVVSAHLVEATPTYWKSEKEMHDINGDVSWKLLKSEQFNNELSSLVGQQCNVMNAAVANSHCQSVRDPSEPLLNKGEFNLAKNGNFNAQKDYWNPFGSGYNLVHIVLIRVLARNRHGTHVENDNDDASSGFT